MTVYAQENVHKLFKYHVIRVKVEKLLKIASIALIWEKIGSLLSSIKQIQKSDLTDQNP